MTDLATKKLGKELNALKGNRHVEVMKQPVHDALVDFCRQDGEFAQAVYQGGTFAECMEAVAKGCGNALRDLEAYRPLRSHLSRRNGRPRSWRKISSS